MAQCFRPDIVMRSGSVMPAGCYYNIERVVRGIANDFTRDPSVVAHQYAGQPIQEQVSPGGGSPPFVPPTKRPNFLARFFGAK